jgi:hypothetical protein
MIAAFAADLPGRPAAMARAGASFTFTKTTTKTS